MSITTLDGYIAAQKFKRTWMKTGTLTMVAAMSYSTFHVAGNPAPGVSSYPLGATSGLVPTSSTLGYITLPSFGGSSGYISRVEYGSSVPGWLDLYDRLYVAGASTYLAGSSITAPSYASRVPLADYSGLQIWAEQIVVGVGVQHLFIGYTDQDGNAGHTGDVTLITTTPVGRCQQIPFMSGDNGVRNITHIKQGTATEGTFNIMVLRPLWSGRVVVANGGDVHDLLRTGMPKIYDTSALYMLLTNDSTAVGLPDTQIEIAVG